MEVCVEAVGELLSLGWVGKGVAWRGARLEQHVGLW